MKKRKAPESIPKTEDASLPCGRAAAGVAQDVAHAGLLVQVRETIYLARPRCSCPWPGLCPGEPATLAIRQHRAGRGMALALMSYRRYSCPCYGHTASAATVSAPSDGAAHALLRLSMRPGHSAFARCALGSNRELCRARRGRGESPVHRHCRAIPVRAGPCGSGWIPRCLGLGLCVLVYFVERRGLRFWAWWCVCVHLAGVRAQGWSGQRVLPRPSRQTARCHMRHRRRPARCRP